MNYEKHLSDLIDWEETDTKKDFSKKEFEFIKQYAADTKKFIKILRSKYFTGTDQSQQMIQIEENFFAE